MDKPTDRVEFEMMLLGRHVHLSAHSKRTSASLDRSAYILLSRLTMQGPMSIGQLSEAFGLDASTLNRQTAAMVRAGLVERIPDTEGGIARKFRVTDEGAQRLEEARTELVGAFDSIFADWSAEEVAQFAACLEHFNASIERLDGRPWPRP